MTERDSGARATTKLKDPQMLRLLMESHNISGRQLSRLVGVSPATMSRLINGRVSNVNNDVAHQIAKRVRVDFDDLFIVEVFHVTRDYAHRNARVA
jgi:transcriptional regulator with XRE-family HTH domain